MMFQYYEILDYYWLYKLKQQFMAHLQQWFYDPCLESVAMKHKTMTNDDDGNEDQNNNNNADSGSGSDGSIFNSNMIPWSCGGGSGNNSDIATAVV